MESITTPKLSGNLVHSLQNPDLKSLLTTVTDNSKFFFLTNRGQLIDTLQGYCEFHEAWHKEKKWKMPVGIPEIWPDTSSKKKLGEIAVIKSFIE